MPATIRSSLYRFILPILIALVTFYYYGEHEGVRRILFLYFIDVVFERLVVDEGYLVKEHSN